MATAPMTDTTYLIRPCEVEAIAWTGCPPEEERRLVEELGFTRVDRSAFEVHQETWGEGS